MVRSDPGAHSSRCMTICYCGESVVSPQPAAKYCSEACRRRANNRRKALKTKERSRRKLIRRTCGACGRSFSGSRKVKYCSSGCRSEARPPRAPKVATPPRADRVCLCGSSFTPSGPQIHCSRKCRRKANDPRPTRFSTCKYCESEYVLVTNSRKDCCRSDDCRSRAHSAAQAKYNMQRRFRKRGLRSERVDPHVVFDRDEWTCKICGDPIDQGLEYPDPGYPSIDHIVPLVRGGVHTYENVQASHLRCNLKKGARVAS